MSSAADYNDRAILLRSNSLGSDDDLERGAAQSPKTSTSASDLFKRRFTSHHRISSSSSDHPNDDSLAQGAPPSGPCFLSAASSALLPASVSPFLTAGLLQLLIFNALIIITNALFWKPWLTKFAS